MLLRSHSRMVSTPIQSCLRMKSYFQRRSILLALRIPSSTLSSLISYHSLNLGTTPKSVHRCCTFLDTPTNGCNRSVRRIMSYLIPKIFRRRQLRRRPKTFYQALNRLLTTPQSEYLRFLSPRMTRRVSLPRSQAAMISFPGRVRIYPQRYLSSLFIRNRSPSYLVLDKKRTSIWSLNSRKDLSLYVPLG